MICPSCGMTLDVDEKFCPNCGNAIPELPETDEFDLTAAQPEAAQSEPVEDLFAEDLFPAEAPVQTDAAQAEEAPVQADADEFDPRAFAGLDDSNDFDPRTFAGLDLDEMEPAADEIPQQPAKKGKKAAKKEKKAPNEGKPRKKRAGLIVTLILVGVLVLGVAAAAALWFLTAPKKTDLLQADFEAASMLAEGETLIDFTVDRREADRIGRSDGVWCTVVSETESVRYERSYFMAYKLGLSGWELMQISDDAADTWTSSALVGVSEDVLKTILVGQQLQPEEEFSYTLTAEDVESVQIVDQNTDLKAGTDAVEFTVTVVGEQVAWSVDADAACVFEDGWTVSELTCDEAVVDYKPGMDFDLEEKDLLKALRKNPIILGEKDEEEETTMEVITIVDDADDTTEEAAPAETAPVADADAPAAEADAAEEEETQTVTVTKSGVSEFTIVDSVFSLAEGKQLVTCTFALDKGVAKLFVEAVLTCGHDGSKWVVEEVDYDANVEEIILEGKWLGTYTESESRKPNVTVTYTTAQDGKVTCTFAFSPSEATPIFYYGSYYLTATTDVKTMEVSFEPGEWENNPWAADLNVVGLKGMLMIDDAVITDGSTFSIKLDRPEPVEEEEDEEEEEEVEAAETAADTTEDAAAPAAEPTTQTAADTAAQAPANTTPAGTANAADSLNTSLGDNDLPFA